MKLLVLVLAMIATAMASSSFADPLDDSRLELQVKKKMKIFKALQLNEYEADQFWLVYDEYARDLDVVVQDYFDLLREFGEGYQNGTLTEDQAAEMLKRHFEIQNNRLAVKESYVDDFEQVLPFKKVVRFYQLDNKIDSFIQCDIAKKLPLIHPDEEF